MNLTHDPATFQLPDQLSTHAAQVDSTYYFIYWLCVGTFIAIVGAMVYFVMKYRRKGKEEAEPTGHNLVLEIGWTVAPIPLLVVLFFMGFRGYLGLSIAPSNALEIRVNAKQWGWEFVYPGGIADSNLHVPEKKPVKLIMASADVVHAFYAPALRIKRDIVPGMYSSLWFEATHTGTDDIFCAEYCGGKSKDSDGNELANSSGHWNMHANLVVDSEKDFADYLKKLDKHGDPVEWGKSLYTTKSCFTCHTVDGVKSIGPSWKGLFGRQEALGDGTTVKVDENYLRTSILEPNAQVVKDFAPIMPTFKGQIADEEIDAIIAYIKSLK